MGGGGAVQEITRIWQVEASKYPRNKFYRLGRGGGCHRVLVTGARGGD